MAALLYVAAKQIHLQVEINPNLILSIQSLPVSIYSQTPGIAFRSAVAAPSAAPSAPSGWI